MTDLTITADRAELLRAARDGQLRSYRQFSKKRINEKTTHHIGDRDGRKVTSAVDALRAAGLLFPGRRLGPSIYSPQEWELTDAGRKALADHDATERN